MKYIKGKNYQVTKDEWVELPFRLPCDFSVADGLVYSITERTGNTWLYIKKGWTWDGASFILFRLLGTPASWLLYSLYHDALYAPIRRGLLGREYRMPVDRMFRDGIYTRMCAKWVPRFWRLGPVVELMIQLIAWLAYQAIRVGGNFAVRKDVIEREVA